MGLKIKRYFEEEEEGGNGYGCQDNEAETLSKVFHSLKIRVSKEASSVAAFPARLYSISKREMVAILESNCNHDGVE